MEQRQPTFIQQNTPFGFLIGGCCIAASYVCFKRSGNIYANPALDKILAFLLIVGLFMQIRRYRESEELKGYITYGKALLTGIYLSAVSGLFYGVYTFILYSKRPELLSNYLATVGQAMRELYANSPFADDMVRMLHAFTTPISIGFSEFFSKSLMGILYTLLIAFILKRRRPREFHFPEPEK